MTTALLAVTLLGIGFAFIAIRILLVKGGEFKGTCASNNPLLQKADGSCGFCGRQAGEVCKNDEAKA
ncbi:MAG: membrane or secreted protein [Bacteroidia bacterium]|nr:membrane or secreted protein [Bacteroidia bacterium]NNM15158.1 membrane or secreted protein [Bacteroidia bacterium]